MLVISAPAIKVNKWPNLGNTWILEPHPRCLVSTEGKWIRSNKYPPTHHMGETAGNKVEHAQWLSPSEKLLLVELFENFDRAILSRVKPSDLGREIARHDSNYCLTVNKRKSNQRLAGYNSPDERRSLFINHGFRSAAWPWCVGSDAGHPEEGRISTIQVGTSMGGRLGCNDFGMFFWFLHSQTDSSVG